MKTKILVKKLRKTVGLTQQELGDLLGVSRQYIAKMEGTDGDILLQNYLKMCKVVGFTDYNFLFSEEEQQN